LRTANTFSSTLQKVLFRKWIQRQHSDLMLNAKPDTRTAKRCFRKALKSNHDQSPRVINAEQNATYPTAINVGFKVDKSLTETSELLENNTSQQHRRTACPSIHQAIGLL
jgi:transposase-like protein